MDPFSGDRATPAPRVGTEPETPQESTHKGTTKTVSPRRSFKRKPRK